MATRELVDANKVNNVLKEFEVSLKKHKPNLHELALITRKINELYQRNVRKNLLKNRKPPSTIKSPSGLAKKWRKINID